MINYLGATATREQWGCSTNDRVWSKYYWDYDWWWYWVCLSRDDGLSRGNAQKSILKDLITKQKQLDIQATSTLTQNNVQP